MVDSLWYPSVEDVVDIHEDIVSEYPETDGGVRNRGDIEFALDYIETGSFGEVPEGIHETAFHLLRLLVANHPFVDANKRTALNTTTVFYFLNGYRFGYDHEIRSFLKRFAVEEAAVDEPAVVEYLQSHTEQLDLAAEIEDWREALVQFGVDELTGTDDPNDYPRTHATAGMATEEGVGPESPLDEVMADIRQELVRRVAAADRKEHHDVYDALEDE